MSSQECFYTIGSLHTPKKLRISVTCTLSSAAFDKQFLKLANRNMENATFFFAVKSRNLKGQVVVLMSFWVLDYFGH